MSYLQDDMEIQEADDGSGQARIALRDAGWNFTLVRRDNRQNAAQALAGGDYVVLPAAEADRLQRQENRAEDAISRLLAVKGAAAEESENLDTAYVRNRGHRQRDGETSERILVAGVCPSCQHARLVLNESGRVVCENTQCAIPTAAGETLVDPGLRCLCGTLKTEPSQTIGRPPHPTCAWHEARAQREHLGWTIQPIDEFGDVAGDCPSCQHPRLILTEHGRLRCTNPDCDDPNAALKALVDSDLRCRCGTRKTEDNPDCAWHGARAEREHRGWVIAEASEFADLLDAVNELIEQLRLSVEYVGIDVLQPWPGWGWYDALKKHMAGFDEWLATMPSRSTAYLASRSVAGTHDNIDNVLATLEFAKGTIEDLEDDDSDSTEDNRVYVEQLDRLISACGHVRRDIEREAFQTARHAANEGSNGGEALLGVVPARDNATYPFVDGDTVVLGPEIFAHADGTVINWKGKNYYPRPDPAFGSTGDGAAWAGEKTPEEKRYVEAFQNAWHAADERGETGRRTLHGVRAVLDTVEDLNTDDVKDRWVKGLCPACGQNQLVVSESGHILCSYRHCTNIGESVAVEDLNPADRVKGRCPACGQHELGLDQSGRVLCSHKGCADPGAADHLLERGHIGESVAVEDLNPGDRVRAAFCGAGDEWYTVEGEISVSDFRNDETLHVGGPGRRVRTHSGNPDLLLDEVFLLERAATSKTTEENAQAQVIGRALHRVECDKEGVNGDWDSLAEWAKGEYLDSALALIHDHRIRVEQKGDEVWRYDE